MSTTQNTPSRQNDKVEEYDLVILGGGTGGTVAAWTFASEGQRAAVIERKYAGASCANFSCLPRNITTHSGKAAFYFRRSREFRITKRKFAVDMRAVRGRNPRRVPPWTRHYPATRSAL